MLASLCSVLAVSVVGADAAPQFVAYLPSVLLGQGPRGLLWWQWLAFVLLVLSSWVLARVLSWISGTVLKHLAARTKVHWDDLLVKRLTAPITLAWLLLLTSAGLHFLVIPEAALPLFTRSFRVGAFLVFFWVLLRSIDVVTAMMASSDWAQEHPSSRSLVPLGSRVAKVSLLAIAVVAVVSELGYPVASLVAGLGIGGLAFALAAQKTVENLFGAFSLGVDQPFREGDFVRVEDFVGTVEAIGLRSTRFRTLERTLVSIPNGKLADMRLESFTARDSLRLFCVLRLTYDTRVEQMRGILAALEQNLLSTRKVKKDGLTVRFAKFNDSSLDIEVSVWFQTADWNEFTAIRQDVLLTFMATVEGAGASFAFPTRTLHMVNNSGAVK